MPVRRIEVMEEFEEAAKVSSWEATDFIVAAFALAMPAIAVCLILLTR